MKSQLLQLIALCALLIPALPTVAGSKEFSFGVISYPQQNSADESTLHDVIDETDAENLAFVVANSIKAASEPCTDQIYNQRKALLQTAKNGVIVSLAAADWAECKSNNGKPSAVGKLNRLRELFFADEFSFGAARIPLVRQSANAKFRSYAENARWEIGNTMFATINLPADNNHYVSDAGRNSEFEDRLVANRDWLRRIFTYATRKKLAGIVLFCDGNPLLATTDGKRDGFAEMRRHIIGLVVKFPGKVLLVHGQHAANAGTAPDIIWHGNMGELDAGSSWVKLTVNVSHPALFTIANEPAQAANRHQ